jgi:sensor histidine kinase regulating citrate/malate metabolism
MFTNISARITLSLMVVLSAAVALIALLSFNKYQKAIEQLVEARYRFVLQDVAQTLSLSLDLRIPLDELNSLQSVVERRRSMNSDMQYIEIFDADGDILFSSDRTTIGDVLPERWIAENLQAGATPWRRHDEDALVLGLPIRTSFGQTIGGIVLAYSTAPIQAQLDDMAWQLFRNAALTVGAFVVLLMITLHVLLQPPRRRLRQVAALLDGLPDRAPSSPPQLPAVAAAAGAVLAAGEALAAASQELQQLDQEP